MSIADRLRSFEPLRRSALLITFWTGFSGLVYEVTWHKYLSNLLGSQARAAALILAVFLAGLSLGYLLFGKLSSRWGTTARALRLCGLIELGIGVWCALFPLLYRFIWQNSGVLSVEGVGAILSDIGISVLLMGLPTVLMGGTLPLLTQGLSRNLDEAGPVHAQVYAVNTGGACIGAFLAGLFILPAYGLPGTMWLASAVNLLAGGALLYLASLHGSSEEAAVPASDPVKPRWLVRLYLVAFLAGFYAITLQIVFMRVVGLSVGSSEYAFSMIVSAFIMMLAIGAWRLGKKGRVPLWFNQSVAFGSSLALYCTIPDWPYWCHALRSLFASVGPNFYLYFIDVFVVLCLVLAIPVGAMGGTMPLVFRRAADDPSQLGVHVGRLYMVNTIGCVAGALIGGYWLFYYMNLDSIFRLCLLCMLLTVLLTAPWKSWDGSRRLAVFLLALLCFVGALSAERWDIRRLNSGLFRETSALRDTFEGPEIFFTDYWLYETLAYWDDPNTSVYISERRANPVDKKYIAGAESVRNLRVNGKSDGETSGRDMITMRLLGHLPMLLSRNTVKSTAVVGFGLGVTAGTLTLYPELERLTVIEISPAVREFAHYFDFANHNVTKSSRLRWATGDAYRVLGGSEERFSLIISEPSNPWVTGVERLFSKEFYQLVKSRLESEGIYAQWFHTYDMSEATMGIVLNTFASEFPHVRVFAAKNDMILLGTQEPLGKDSLTHLASRYENLPDVRQSLAQIGYANIEALLASELWLPVQYFNGRPLHTLEHPRLAYSAGKDFFLSEDALPEVIVSKRPAAKPWVRRHARSALIGEWLRGAGDIGPSLELFAKAACEKNEVEFFHGWRERNPSCRGALTALAILGRMEESPEGPSKAELGVLQTFRNVPGEALDFWESLGKATGHNEAVTLIRLFSSYDSSFLSLSVPKLMASTKSCTENADKDSLNCRVELARALAEQGYGYLAGGLYQTIKEAKHELGKDEKEQLEVLLNQAIRAEQSLP